MANLSIIGSHKVNGVAACHTELLRTTIFKDFFELEPNKLINITNGVTPWRWILGANKDLAELYTSSLASSEWLVNLEKLRNL